MENQRFKNQRGLISEADMSRSILIIGAGAIGSYYATTLAKMGFQDITVYDQDTIEDHNIANQMYPVPMIGKPKVEALAIVCMQYASVNIKPMRMFWTPEKALMADIIVSAVDDMDVRANIWNFYKDKGIQCFVDGRMGAQVYRAYSVDMKDPKEVALYEASLYPQDEAAPEPCGQKSIIFNVLQVAGAMLAMTKQFVRSEYRPAEVIYDAVNFFMERTYCMEQPIEHIEAPDEEELVEA